uniref:TAXi_C domain-containing protein n=1 Tax=Haemonchus contortus TaxID=6289 RepID=A0A7I4YJ24_HAECO
MRHNGQRSGGKIFVFILIVAASVRCQIPRWKPRMGIGPVSKVCRWGRAPQGSCYYPLTRKTVYFRTGALSSTPTPRKALLMVTTPSTWMPDPYATIYRGMLANTGSKPLKIVKNGTKRVFAAEHYQPTTSVQISKG